MDPTLTLGKHGQHAQKYIGKYMANIKQIIAKQSTIDLIQQPCHNLMH